MATPSSLGTVTPYFKPGVTAIDGLLELDGAKWGAAVGTGATLSYSFLGYDNIAGTTSFSRHGGSAWFFSDLLVYGGRYSYGPESDAWYALGSAEASAMVSVLGAWAEVANITLAPSSDNASVVGDIRLGHTAAAEYAYSFAYLPGVLPSGGDIWVSGNVGTDLTRGGNAWYTYLHEVGHALGLGHPHENGLPLSADVFDNTVMSYRAWVGDSLDNPFQWNTVFPITPMPYDILAIQYLYGANTSTRAGDTVYSWAPGATIFETIWDGGGNDTIDWSNQSSAASINLVAGEWSHVGPGRPDATDGTTNRNLAIAWGASIENASGGSGNDTLIGNELGNLLRGGGGNDFIDGDDGNDISHGDDGDDGLLGGPGSNILYGGGGNDVLNGGEWGDWLQGDDGNDAVFGGPSGPDILLGGAGNDLVSAVWQTTAEQSIASGERVIAIGGPGADSVYGGPGDDWVDGGIGDGDNDAVLGGDGHDTVVGGGGVDMLFGGRGNDVLIQGAAAGSTFGEAGDDWLWGGSPADTLSGGPGSDNIVLFTGGADLVVFNRADVTAGALEVLHGYNASVPADTDRLSFVGITAGEVTMLSAVRTINGLSLAGTDLHVQLTGGVQQDIFVVGATPVEVAANTLFA